AATRACRRAARLRPPSTPDRSTPRARPQPADGPDHPGRPLVLDALEPAAGASL
ncbi:MAG: hypothetical protein AVDCRST_MAG57-418, partial [uncultured Blastococcus sp.]